MDMGFALNEDDIHVVRGAKRFQDIIQCWSLFASKDGRTWEITSCYTLTELARKGFTLVEGNDKSQIHGDFLAEPIEP